MCSLCPESAQGNQLNVKCLKACCNVGGRSPACEWLVGVDASFLGGGQRKILKDLT